MLTWSVAKNTFAVDTGRFAYTAGGKAPALSFVVSLLIDFSQSYRLPQSGKLLKDMASNKY